MKDHIYPEEFKDQAITRLLNRMLIDELRTMPIKEETADAILAFPVSPSARYIRPVVTVNYSGIEKRISAYYEESDEVDFPYGAKQRQEQLPLPFPPKSDGTEF